MSTSRSTKRDTYELERVTSTIMGQLEWAMAYRGVSRAELARRCSVTPAVITMAFKRRTGVRMDSLVRMARALGCTVAVTLTPTMGVEERTRRRDGKGEQTLDIEVQADEAEIHNHGRLGRDGDHPVTYSEIAVGGQSEQDPGQISSGDGNTGRGDV